MSDFQDFVKDAMAAPPERLEAAKRILRGELPKPEPYLNLRELSRRLGYGVTTLRRWSVPGHHLGGHQRYRLSEVEAYLRSEDFQRRLAAIRAERRLSARGMSPRPIRQVITPKQSMIPWQ